MKPTKVIRLHLSFPGETGWLTCSREYAGTQLTVTLHNDRMDLAELLEKTRAINPDIRIEWCPVCEQRRIARNMTVTFMN